MRTLVLLLCTVVHIFPMKGDFIEAPQSVNASLNTTAQFHCCAAGFSIQWNVDGAIASSPVIQDRGITYKSVSGESPSGDSVVWNSTLNIAATKRNNNTRVFCVLYTDLEGGIAKSDEVYLIIESPKDFQEEKTAATSQFPVQDFIEAPQSVNTSLNTTAQFHCCAAAISIQWNVDGAIASSPVIQDRGITFKSVSGESPSGDSVVWNSTLNIAATERNNNTRVFCVLYTDLEGGIAKSDEVYLIVESAKDFQEEKTAATSQFPVQDPMTSENNNTPRNTTAPGTSKIQDKPITYAIIPGAVLIIILVIVALGVIIMILFRLKRKKKTRESSTPSPLRQNSEVESDGVNRKPPQHKISQDQLRAGTSEEPAKSFKRSMSHPPPDLPSSQTAMRYRRFQSEVDKPHVPESQ